MEPMCANLWAYLSKKYKKNHFGLDRDDGLAILKNKSGPQSERW